VTTKRAKRLSGGRAPRPVRKRAEAPSNAVIATAAPPSLEALLEQEIGVRLRHARLMRGARLKDVAAAAGCSESFLSKLENGKVQPSLHVLHKICAELGLTLGGLFDGAVYAETVVTRAGQRSLIALDSLRRGKGLRMERVIPYASGHLLQSNIHIMDPGGATEGQITHAGEEVGYVISGDVELTIGDKSYRLRAGDTFCFRSEVQHGYRNVGSGEARLFWVNTPPTF
jgi:transcriptional regulator with XRE-family HTH domain